MRCFYNVVVVLSDRHSDKWAAVVGYLRAEPPSRGDKAAVSSEDPEYPLQRTLRQRQRRLSSSELEELVRRYQAGETTYQLAEAYGCNRHTISGKLKAAGIEFRKNIASPMQVQEIERFRDSGLAQAEIGAKIGLSQQTVSKYFRQG